MTPSQAKIFPILCPSTNILSKAFWKLQYISTTAPRSTKKFYASQTSYNLTDMEKLEATDMPISVTKMAKGGEKRSHTSNMKLNFSLPFGWIKQNSLENSSAMFIGHEEQVREGLLYRHHELLASTYINTGGLWVLHFLLHFSLAIFASRWGAPLLPHWGEFSIQFVHQLYLSTKTKAVISSYGVK